MTTEEVSRVVAPLIRKYDWSVQQLGYGVRLNVTDGSKQASVDITGGEDIESEANRLIEAGLIDAAAFGRDFIANPDLPERFATRAELNLYRGELAYGGGAAGYTDYPFLETQCEGATHD